MIHYLIELTIIHSLLILGYWMFLKNETQYSKLRLYLVGSTLLSLIVPLLRLPSFQSLLFPGNEKAAFSVTLDPVSYIPISEGAQAESGPGAFLWLYLLISCWFLYKILLGLVYLFRLRFTSESKSIFGIDILKAPNLKGSFTFFDWIFVNDRIEENDESFLPIVKHEYAHARLGHSYDLVFFQLFRMVFWWIPSGWYINKEIKKIHEYQADAYALKSYSIDQYSSILISSTLKSNGLSLASSFHDGLILKRLKAMKQTVRKINPWKLGVLGILSALLIITFACNEELDQEIKKMGESGNAISFDQLPANMQKGLIEIKDDLSFMKVEVGEDDKLSNIEEVQALDPELIHSINVDKNARSIYIAIKKDGANFDYVSNQSKMDGEVFTMVEDQPTYPGGIEEFYRYVGEEIKYPKAARQAGVSGRVYVQFIVNKDGSLSDVKAVKGIGGGCDAEAVRVVENSPQWQPGKQRGKEVKVRMVMPVVFSLEGQVQTPSAVKIREDADVNAMDEMVVVGYGDPGDAIEVPESGETTSFIKHEKFIVEAKYEDGAWKGTVVDSETKNPLPGANIVVAGSSRGTVSDLNGNYKIQASEDAELVVSFMGYESVKITNK